MKKNSGIYDRFKTQNYYLEITRSGYQEKQYRNYQTISPNYVFEYFTAGESTIKIDKTPHKVQKGDLILWPCNKVITATPNPSFKHEYWWVNFFGPNISHVLEQIGFSESNPVIRYDDDNVAEFMKKVNGYVNENSLQSRLSALSCFYELLSYLIAFRKVGAFESDVVDRYVDKAVWYIQHNFRYDIKTQDIASHVNISESYLNSIFVKKIGTSPIDYLINYRIEQAQNMLTSPDLPIVLIAQNCGFNSPSYFTLRFKELTGMTPKEYRAQKQIK